MGLHGRCAAAAQPPHARAGGSLCKPAIVMLYLEDGFWYDNGSVSSTQVLITIEGLGVISRNSDGNVGGYVVLRGLSEGG